MGRFLFRRVTEISPAVFHLHRLVPQRLAGGSIEQPPLTTPRRSLCGTDVMGTHAPSPIPLAVNSVNICIIGKLLTELTKAESNSLHPSMLSTSPFLVCSPLFYAFYTFAILQMYLFADLQIYKTRMARSTPSVIRSTSHGFDKRKMTGISHMPKLRLAPLLPADALRELHARF